MNILKPVASSILSRKLLFRMSQQEVVISGTGVCLVGEMMEACRFSALYLVHFHSGNLYETDLGLGNQEHVTR